MGRKLLWLAGAVALCAAAAGGAYEVRGRALRREDSARTGPCVDGSQFRLKDGRLLGYLETGKPDGVPVFYFHGALGSRLEWPVSRPSVGEAGLRLIAVDRPAYGCSDPAPGRKPLDFAADVEELADGLGVGRFRIVAWSAGSVFAMASAVRMPDRVERLELVGAVVPESWPEGREARLKDLARLAALAQWAPGTAYTTLRRTIARREAEPEWFEDRLARGLSAVDQRVVESAEVRPVLKRSHAEGQRRLGGGIIGDLEGGGGDWGFTPAQVKCPVVMWQGSDDTLTPAERNVRLLREFSRVELKRFQGEGHFLLYRHERELLDAAAR